MDKDLFIIDGDFGESMDSLKINSFLRLISNGKVRRQTLDEFKNDPVICLSQFDAKQTDNIGNCFPHIALSVDPESNMVFDPMFF